MYSQLPLLTRVRDSDWKKLVEHWKKEDAEEEAERNKRNREQFEFPLRTGRTSFADIRLVMMENGEDISRQNVLHKTPTKKNGGVTEEVDAALAQMNRKLSDVPESERTPEFIDQVFTEVMGVDGHGRVRTFGLGPTPKTVFGSNSSSAVASSDRIKKIIDAKVDARMAEMEHNRQEDITVEVQRQLVAYGIAPASNYPPRGSPRVPSSVGQVPSTSSEDGFNGNYEMCS